ncbi:MAG: MOSC N-terminal beta barrel domain-containing protein [Rubrivivax sp.]
MSNLNFSLSALYLHPVKSCAGMAVNEALLVETGLDLDRAWMVVDPNGEFVSQRELPRMALIQPTLRHDDLRLRAPGMLALHLSFDRVEAPTRAHVWNDWVAAYDMGDLAAQWFTDFLGRSLRLVRFDIDQPRLSDSRWTAGLDAQTQFADAFALLVLSKASLDGFNRRLALDGGTAVDMRRFRPNLVLDGIEAHDEDHIDELHIDTDDGEVRLKLVKPCARCSIPDVDPDTAVFGHAVGDVLATYRADARVGGALTFGMNAVVLEGVDRVLRVGQTGRARIAF